MHDNVLRNAKLSQFRFTVRHLGYATDGVDRGHVYTACVMTQPHVVDFETIFLSVAVAKL